MKRPQLVSAGSVARMLKAAEDAWHLKQFQQSIEILERASRLDPGNSKVLLELGHRHGLLYDYAAAERCFEKAIRVAPKKTEALAMAGEQSLDFAGDEMAEHFFKRALEERDVLPETIILLAEIHERHHRLEDANGLVDRALQLDANCGWAWLARARLDRQAGRLEQAEKAVRSLLNLPDPGTQESRARDTRIRGFYELGAILDRQSRFDEAMTAFVRAKSMLRLHAVQQLTELKAIHASINQLRESISQEMLHRWFDFGAHLQPPRRLALLGGHSRSGTTLLEQVLDSHPNIISAEETGIFYNEVYAAYMQRLAGTQNAPAALAKALQVLRENYFRSMEAFLGKPVGARLLIDKNPVLTFLIPYFIRVFPETQFLIALRDPRDVCISSFMQPFPLRQTNAGPRVNRAATLSLEGVIENYVSLMNIWTTAAPLMKNAYLEVRYEDIVGDLEAVSRKVLNFLGVPWDPRILHFDEHARLKAVRSPTYADVAKPVFKTAVGRWRNYQTYFEPHLARLEPFVKKFGYE